MNLRDTIDELDLLVSELVELRQLVRVADLAADDGMTRERTLWDAEARLRRVSERSGHRAAILRRAAELSLDDRRPRSA